MEPELIITNSQIDIELAELLGGASSDFLVLYLNGQQMEGFGTPFDRPGARKQKEEMVERLNNRSKDSWWPELFCNWRSNICKQFGLSLETTSDEFRPVVSYKVHRVCCCYSEHLHAAIRLFDRVGDKVKTWRVGRALDGRHVAYLTSIAGPYYIEIHESLPVAIVLVIKRLLLELKSN